MGLEGRCWRTGRGGWKRGEGESRGGGDLPVNRGLPRRIVEAVEHVQKHRAQIATTPPIQPLIVVRRRYLPRHLLALPRPTAAPDNHRDSEQDGQTRLGPHAAANRMQIQRMPEHKRPDNLADPVQRVIQGARAHVEVRRVDGVELVRVEPVRGEEHGEEEDDVGVGSDGLVEAEELGLPGRVLHQDDAGAVFADDLVGIHEEEGQDCAKEH